MTKKEIGYVIPSLKGRRHEVPHGQKGKYKANFFKLIISTLIWRVEMENLNLTWLGWGI